MKINDVLNCINKTLEVEREARGLQRVTGHFVFHLDIQKGMGHIKTFHAYIDFFNMKYKKTYRTHQYDSFIKLFNDFICVKIITLLNKNKRK